MTTPAVRGMVAQMLFSAAAMQRGFDVYYSIREDSPADVVIDYEGRLQRVQVKRAFRPNKRFQHLAINLKRRDGSRYRKAEVDLVAAVDVPSGRIWVFPFEHLFDGDRPLGRVRLTPERDVYQWDMS